MSTKYADTLTKEGFIIRLNYFRVGLIICIFLKYQLLKILILTAIFYKSKMIADIS